MWKTVRDLYRFTEISGLELRPEKLVVLGLMSETAHQTNIPMFWGSIF